MAVIGEYRKEVAIQMGRSCGGGYTGQKPHPELAWGASSRMGHPLLHLVATLLLAVLLFATLFAIPVLGQGGPPLLTDDPGTPGRNNWEINLGYTVDRQAGDNYYETPILDMNYGWGDRVQLKFEMPYIYNSVGNGPLQSGPGDSKVGVKIRFFEDEKLGLNLGTYPQLEVNNTQDSVRRNLVYKGPQFLLPVEITKRVGPVDVDVEVEGRFALF